MNKAPSNVELTVLERPEMVMAELVLGCEGTGCEEDKNI